MASLSHSDHIAMSGSSPGAIYLLDHVVHQLAAKNKANLLTLDPYDFVFLAQKNFSRDVATVLPILSSMDADSNVILALSQPSEEEEEEVEDLSKGDNYEIYLKDDSEHEQEEEDRNHDKLKINIQPNKFTFDNGIEIDLDDIDTGSKHIHRLTKATLYQISQKYTAMFKQLLTENNEPKIVYLRDYGSMQDAFTRIMLKSLATAVESLKQKDHAIMIMASYGQEDTIPVIPNLRTIRVLPSLQNQDHIKQWKSMLKSDQASYHAEINAKQLVGVYRQKNVHLEHQGLLEGLMTLNLSKSVWHPDQVDRRVMTAIGHALYQNKTKIEVEDFVKANEIIDQVAQLNNEKKLNHDMEYLKKTCNEYEKKLLTRIVNPSQVEGSFKQVRAPASTTETLQTLISLPLIRPDLFNKGILKKNFIPGVLLFGPPGTGKTMLAKAVAKESGSRMLDIQASDVYDMYVGQGEKNVKAIFSLARKLSPCVIFIDEVDSLMNKRGSDYSSKSHREIINQFMVEWDGLSSNNQGVIVMAATNRPFDLDDAVLRRMPRRILVDLPNQQDRIEILNILLQDEPHQVSLVEIAKATEHYSGSDLKNVCVTAALKAVQQQVATNIPQVLTMEHFKEAIRMVPPSSSEEMESLVEIRKWDSKFGDGKKKNKVMIGF
ncbi:P-loop containing nucleoside triphosphate hydrolase protein [Gilbertella persicaria]|uniref:P-loop containing nucleoside triphosphate hydrolase protein n=1 Tax=Gilbertella persicaria TaxID=101096 RepID=UPI002220AC1E|nr:P-loop containing nucleoside triphosphate hydrolase protein [Gilbertella persicaria]KAI8092235.1 P-loop containing nucleoside triphosphate hydrolase protein [Gilbertella persicaria]